MTIKNLYPDARPQSIYNVINGRPELPAASTFSQPNATWNFNPTGVLQENAPNTPRFEYDPETGEFTGLLLEDSVTNLCPSSEVMTGTAITVDLPGPYGELASRITNGKSGTTTGNEGLNSETCFYCYVNPLNRKRLSFGSGGAGMNNSTIGGGSNKFIDTYNFVTGEWDYRRRPWSVTKLSNGWYRFELRYLTGPTYQGSAITVYAVEDSANAEILINTNVNDYTDPNGVFGMACTMMAKISNRKVDITPQYIKTTGSKVTNPADQFSLTTTSNFDGGFSLLLDSDTTTQEYLYRIKAGGTTISELKNDNGTLEWDINGTSAQTDGLYPQVGFVLGRVRTVSSFGAANGEVQNNYLYTTGLSFPTPAVVASGADELEFGVPQTLKALYLWNGQLSDTEAVSVIKGEYNVVPIEPIKTDSYSFVYNTDSTNEGVTTIDLPYIVPTDSMRIYWGDGDQDQRYEQGVLPQHTYPYPGQYRIQIEADDGFDGMRLGDRNNSIMRVDQWPPAQRVGASGDGFTGTQFAYMLDIQSACTYIPPFKYTNLTSLVRSFYTCRKLAVNSWNWVPRNLPECTSLGNAFSVVSLDMPESRDKPFPTLQTSSKLTNVYGCFDSSGIKSFENDTPFSDSSGITNWTNAFQYMGQLLKLNTLDTSAATNITSVFKSCGKLEATPILNTSSIETFDYAWQDCKAFTSFPTIDTSNGLTFVGTWYGLEVSSFPNLNFSSATSLSNAWRLCENLTSFPNITLPPTCKILSSTWYGCKNLATFPALDCSNVEKVTFTWRETALTSLPITDFSSATDLSGMVMKSAIKVGNLITTSKCLTYYQMFYQNSTTDLPATMDLSGGSDFREFAYSSNLTNIPPNMWDGCTRFRDNCFIIAFSSSRLTVASVENLLVSLDTTGIENISLGMNGGTVADRADWTTAAENAYQSLLGKGWDMAINDTTRSVPLGSTTDYYVHHQDGVVAFGQYPEDGYVESGKANKERFERESDAIARVLELKEDYFDEWDREAEYMVNHYAKFNGNVYRSLVENDARDFELPDQLLNPDAEVATPANRQARWAQVYDPNYEEESYGGPI